MKKRRHLFSVIISLVLVFCMAGTAFAAPLAQFPINEESFYFGNEERREPEIKEDHAEGFNYNRLLKVGSYAFDPELEYTDVVIDYAITDKAMHKWQYACPDGTKPFDDFYLVMGDDPWAGNRCWAGPYNISTATESWDSYSQFKGELGQFWCGPEHECYFEWASPYWNGTKYAVDFEAYGFETGVEEDIYLLGANNGPLNVKSLQFWAIAEDPELVAAAEEAEKALAENPESDELKAAAEEAKAAAEVSKENRVVYETKCSDGTWSYAYAPEQFEQREDGAYYTVSFTAWNSYVYLGEYNFDNGAPTAANLTYGLDASGLDVNGSTAYFVTGDNPSDTAARGWAEMSGFKATDGWDDFQTFKFDFTGAGWPTSGTHKVWMMLGAGLSDLCLTSVELLGAETEEPSEPSEPEATMWTLGKETNVNGPKDGVQGENGWYFMYTEDTDVAKDTKYDVSKMKECTWADKGSMQLESEGGTYKEMWMPANYLQDGLTGDALHQPNASNPDSTFNNWIMTSNGKLDPNVETTAVTGVYAWKAPKAGDYSFDVSYEAGGYHCDLGGTRYYYHKDYYYKDGTPDKMTPEQREGGVAVSVSTKDSKLDYKECAAMTADHDYLYAGTFAGDVTLEKGEMIYFAVDPREFGSYDAAELEISITEANCEWSDVTYKWNDNNICEATVTCTKHEGHVRSLQTEGVLDKTKEYTEATCTQAGEGVFTATFEKDTLAGKTVEAQTATRPIPKKGHNTDNAWNDYYAGKGKIEWSDDYSTATWFTQCGNGCGEYVKVETAETSMSFGTATCTTPGTVIYNASFYWGWLWADPVEVELTEAPGHLDDAYNDFLNGKAEFEWSDDYSTCTWFSPCASCGEMIEIGVADSIEKEVKEESTCATHGKAVYNASFWEGWVTATSEEVELPLGDHNYDNAFNDYWEGKGKIEWSDDYSKATWLAPCSGCGEYGVVEGPIETTKEVKKEATCTEDGTVVYNASFCWGWVPVSTEEITIPATGHNYDSAYDDFWAEKAKFEWSDDYSTCTWTSPCGNCGEYGVIEGPIETTEALDKAPTCTEGGTATYTASFWYGWVVTDSGKVEVGPRHTSNGKWKVDKDATTKADGKKTSTCTECGKKYSVVIPKASTVELSYTKTEYTGSTIAAPVLTVKNSKGLPLKEGIDYTVTGLKDKKSVGRYKVEVKFKGEYTGTKKLYFAIAPKAPSSVTAKLYGYDDVKISWKKSTGAAGYYVYYKKADAAKFSLLGRTTKTYYKKSGLSDGVAYEFQVIPYFKSSGTKYKSDAAAEASVLTLKKVAKPEVVVNGDKVDVTWKSIEGADGYQVSKSTKKSGTSIQKPNAGADETVMTVSATKGKTYYYKVRAYKVVDGKKIYAPWSTAVSCKRK